MEIVHLKYNHALILPWVYSTQETHTTFNKKFALFLTISELTTMFTLQNNHTTTSAWQCENTKVLNCKSGWGLQSNQHPLDIDSTPEEKGMRCNHRITYERLNLSFLFFHTVPSSLDTAAIHANSDTCDFNLFSYKSGRLSWKGQQSKKWWGVLMWVCW